MGRSGHKHDLERLDKIMITNIHGMIYMTSPYVMPCKAPRDKKNGFMR